MDVAETEESRVLLELKALREGAWKLSEYTAYSSRLTLRVTPELKALLKVAHKAHPSIHALLIDLMTYKPTLIVGEKTVAPAEIGMEDPAREDPTPLEDMKKAEGALQKPIHMPPKARFQPGPHIHVQFDGGSQNGIGTGGFVILDQDQKEIIRAGRYYGPGRTNNEAEAFALRDALQCLSRITNKFDKMSPIRVFGDS